MDEIEGSERSPPSKVLNFAVRSGSVALVKFLLWVGVNVNSKYPRKRTALHLACESEHEDMQRVVAVLLSAGAEVNAKSMGGETPLHTACRSLNATAVTTLLKRGANVGSVNDNGRSALHLLAAMTMNHATIPIVHALLAHNRTSAEAPLDSSRPLPDHPGADDLMSVINLQDASGNTALHLASASNLEEVVRLLLILGAKVGVENHGGMTALHWASRACAGDVVDVLVDAGEDVNAKNTLGNTPLHIACIGNNKEVVCMLLRKGAKLGIKNLLGMTDLHTAVKYDSRDVVDVLLENGAGLNVKDSGGNTPLHLACMNNNREVAVSLLRGGANTGVKNDAGSTALHVAVEAFAEAVVDVLLESGEDINAKDSDGDTALHLCSHIYFNHSTTSMSKLIEYLLCKGSKVDEKNDRLKTPYEELLDCSLEMESEDIVEEIFIRQVIRLKTLGLQDKFDINWRLGPNFYENVSDQCFQEIENMKTTEVVTDVSLYDVFLHIHQPCIWSDDELLDIYEFLCSPDLSARFPLYGDSLRTTMQRDQLLTLAERSSVVQRRAEVCRR